MKQTLIAIDKKIYEMERVAVGYFFLAMSAVVFVDVLHRVFSRTPGRMAVLMGSMFGFPVEQFDQFVSPIICLVITLTLSYFAIKHHHVLAKKPFTRGKIWLQAVIAATVLVAATQIFIRLDPQGIVWAPYFGLICVLWIGFIGASMATHTNQHLLLEMGEKIWPEKMLPWIRKLANIVVAILTIALAYLAIISILEHFKDWNSGPGAGLIPSIDWPKWAVYLIIPYAFLVMGMRFIGIALEIFKPEKVVEFS